MEEYYIFTFGSGQTHAGKYVKAYGSYMDARLKMIAKYGLNWGFQYSEKEWNEWVKKAQTYGIPVETELEVLE